jgi:hypothetical protein
LIENLENVQGDERDLIFIGTACGPEELGARVMQRFGPIKASGGSMSAKEDRHFFIDVCVRYHR